MSFNILYVENNPKDWRRVNEAVTAFNAQGERILNVDWAHSPGEVDAKLLLNFDLVLADVFFDDPATGAQDRVDKLDEIIASVTSWSLKNRGGRLLPIIAYTGRGRDALESCLRRRNSLYDIWDKTTASPDYVAWRLARLTIEVTRDRPDSLIQRLMQEMEPGSQVWHSLVVDMVRRYSAGWTERDQVERAGNAVESIANRIGVWDQCQDMWKIMKGWEPLGRAVSRRVRGHSRHVINVFWLGYYLLFSEELRDIFRAYWEKLITERARMEAVKDKDGLEGMANAWFLAALFHDVASCVEKHSQVGEMQRSMLGIFKGIVEGEQGCRLVRSGTLVSSVEELFIGFDKPLREKIFNAFTANLEKGHIDHGVAAAIHLQSVIGHGEQGCYAREAARAMALHNLFSKVKDVENLISWDSEPLSCLLLLCDQIQTWDRERGDQSLTDDEGPERAELSALKVERSEGKLRVFMKVDYIAPPHVTRSPESYAKLKDKLEFILRDNPSRALLKIAKPWPFLLEVDCALSGEPLDAPMRFGS